jgi:protein CpxP
VKRLTQIAMAAGIFALAAAGPAMAHGHCGRGHRMHGGPMPPPLMMTLRAANLTAPQKEQVHKILEASHAQAKPLFKKLHSIHEQIADKLLSEGKVSMSDLAPLQKEQTELRAQLDQQMMETALKVRAVLTPEQLKKMAEVSAKLKAIHKQIEALMGPPPADPSLPSPADQMP